MSKQFDDHAQALHAYNLIIEMAGANITAAERARKLNKSELPFASMYALLASKSNETYPLGIRLDDTTNTITVDRKMLEFVKTFIENGEISPQAPQIPKLGRG